MQDVTSSECKAWRQQHYLSLCLHHQYGIFVWLLKTILWKGQWWSRWENLNFLCKLCLPGLKKQLCTSTVSTANLKWHIELKHPASLSRYVWMNKNQKTWLHVITVQDTVMELYRCVAEIRMKVKFKDRCGPRKGARGAGRKFGPLLNATGPTPLKWQIIVTLYDQIVNPSVHSHSF